MFTGTPALRAPYHASMSSQTPGRALREFFRRNGYLRRPNEDRRRKLGPKYKKGWELRFVLSTRTELTQVRRLLRQLGLRRAKPFKKHTRWVQPVYGKSAIDLIIRPS
jgi:hypothetical protein